VGVQELLWLKLLLTDLGYQPREPMMLYCDNKVACDISHNQVQHDRTKHMEVDIFFIKEKLEKKHSSSASYALGRSVGRCTH